MDFDHLDRLVELLVNAAVTNAGFKLREDCPKQQLQIKLQVFCYLSHLASPYGEKLWTSMAFAPMKKLFR